MPDELMDSCDVGVIGGGSAGLSGALVLARARRSVVVVDAGQPRNAPAHSVHGLLGHDGVPPVELLSRGREEVRRHGGLVLHGEVTKATREGDQFTVQLADERSFRARRLLVATGLTDQLPDIPGLADRWGRDVLHCPNCHGWEVRDQAISVLGTSHMSVHEALLFRQWSDHVTYIAHTMPPNHEQAERLSARGIRMVDGAAVGLVVKNDRLAGCAMVDGSVVDSQAVVVSPRMVARAGFLTDLGLEVKEHLGGIGQHIPADATGMTAVHGVWAAGNVTDLSAQVGPAAAAGAVAGADINAHLVAEETHLAVMEHRNRLGPLSPR